MKKKTKPKAKVKTKVIEKIIEFRPYKKTCLVLMGHSRKEAAELINDFCGFEPDHNWYVTEEYLNDASGVYRYGWRAAIWIEDLQAISVLAHELLHFIFHRFEEIAQQGGLVWSSENSEVFCYALTDLMDQVLEK